MLAVEAEYVSEPTEPANANDVDQVEGAGVWEGFVTIRSARDVGKHQIVYTAQFVHDVVGQCPGL